MEANMRSETMPNPEVKAKANRRRFGKDEILQKMGLKNLATFRPVIVGW